MHISAPTPATQAVQPMTPTRPQSSWPRWRPRRRDVGGRRTWRHPRGRRERRAKGEAHRPEGARAARHRVREAAREDRVLDQQRVVGHLADAQQLGERLAVLVGALPRRRVSRAAPRGQRRIGPRMARMARGGGRRAGGAQLARGGGAPLEPPRSPLRPPRNPPFWHAPLVDAPDIVGASNAKIGKRT